MPRKLDIHKRKRTIPCATQPVKYSHTCYIDARTKLGTDAWKRENSAGAQRVDAIRSLHQMTGSHEAAAAAVEQATQGNVNRSIENVQTRTIVRVVKELEG